MLTVIKCGFSRKRNAEDAQRRQLAVLAYIVFNNNDNGINKNTSKKLLHGAFGHSTSAKRKMSHTLNSTTEFLMLKQLSFIVYLFRAWMCVHFISNT